jgi:uroporphyrinogen III methyltransferase/synthase
MRRIDTRRHAIHGGTTRYQQKVIATLSELTSAVDSAGLKSPVTIIVGEVVSLSDELDWFDSNSPASAEVISYDAFNLARA